MDVSLMNLLADIQSCTLCAEHLPHGVRPVFQFHTEARILIAGQAPGKKVHDSGIPFNDASGIRLREWMGISAEDFYKPENIAILPMGFCYPGRGASGDLPPRKECAAAWRKPLLERLQKIELTLLVGHYAVMYYSNNKRSLTETVKAWREYWPHAIPLPHPSPRNRFWLQQNPWFEHEVLPALKDRVNGILHRRQQVATHP